MVKKWFVKLTHQCSKMLLDGSRCHRKTVLGSDFCFAHLAKLGIREIPIYKSNHKSRVIDRISRIISVGNFFENQKVFAIYGERLSPKEHIQRYQRYDRCGPQEFAFVKKPHDSHATYLDFAQISNTFEFIKFSTDGNCYIDYEEGTNEFWVKAARLIYVNEAITVNLQHAN